MAQEPSQPRQQKPLALRLKDVDPQVSSPFYDGSIPADIRKCIFEYAMVEYVDPELSYPTNTDYTRPNYPGKKKVSINLLLMCKRSYLETHHLPPVKKEHVFWHFAGPEGLPYSHDELCYFSRFQPSQLALVKEIHLFTQQYWLEGCFPAVCRLPVLQGIEKVKITLRRGDWWDNEHNAPLAITPQRERADFSAMKEDWRKEERGETVKWEERFWGSSFRHLRGLKELEMELETYEYKKGELEEIVRHAVKWKFPMGDGKVLSVDGLGVKTSRWRGPPCGWSSKCPRCEGRNKDCKFCEEMRGLKMEGQGPMLIMMNLTWKLAAGK